MGVRIQVARGGFGCVMVSQEGEGAIHRSCVGRRIYTGYRDVRPLFSQDSSLVDPEVCERVCGVHSVREGSSIALDVLDALWRAGLSMHAWNLWDRNLRTCAWRIVEIVSHFQALVEVISSSS